MLLALFSRSLPAPLCSLQLAAIASSIFSLAILTVMALQPDLPPDVQFSTAIWFRPELILDNQRTINHCMDAIGLADLNCEVGHFVRFLQADNNTIHCPDIDRMAHFEIPFEEPLQDGIRYHAIFCDRFLFEYCRRLVSAQGFSTGGLNNATSSFMSCLHSLWSIASFRT